MASCHDEVMGSSEDTGSENVPSRGCIESSLDSMMEEKKRVSWDRIHTREFELVVGDHPMCNDGLPVSLGWQYSDCCPNSLVEDHQLNVSERKHSYVFPRRLSYDERRQRLFLGGLSAEQVRNDEIDLVVRTLKEVWDHGVVEAQELDPLAEIMLCDDENPIDLDFDMSEFEWTD
jgi:hypothetical protein